MPTPNRLSVAEDESRHRIIRQITRQDSTLPELLAELRAKIAFFRYRPEHHIFVDSYGHLRAGFMAYLGPKKSQDPCVRGFCIARLELRDNQVAEQKHTQKLMDFVTNAPAA